MCLHFQPPFYCKPHDPHAYVFELFSVKNLNYVRGKLTIFISFKSQFYMGQNIQDNFLKNWKGYGLFKHIFSNSEFF